MEDTKPVREVFTGVDTTPIQESQRDRITEQDTTKIQDDRSNSTGR